MDDKLDSCLLLDLIIGHLAQGGLHQVIIVFSNPAWGHWEPNWPTASPFFICSFSDCFGTQPSYQRSSVHLSHHWRDPQNPFLEFFIWLVKLVKFFWTVHWLYVYISAGALLISCIPSPHVIRKLKSCLVLLIVVLNVDYFRYWKRSMQHLQNVYIPVWYIDRMTLGLITIRDHC